MPRVSAKEKERSHRRIVKEASQLFRGRGLNNPSVSDVMKSAGLTHGGFYRHFSSKDELVTAALDYAIQDVISDLRNADTPADRVEALKKYVDLYLSPEHVRDFQNGCPLAALAADAGRSADMVRQTTDDGVRHVISLLSRAINDDGEAKAMALLSLLVGSVTLARLSSNVEDVNDLLRAAKISASQLLGLELV